MPARTKLAAEAARMLAEVGQKMNARVAPGK
jgi:hypothetical protein